MFKKIARDKWKHFFIGIPLGVTLECTAYYFFSSHTAIATSFAIVILLLICYGFELFSFITKKGHYEIADAIAGILGGLLGIAVIWFFL